MIIDFAIESSLRLRWRNPTSWGYQLSRFTKLFSSVFIVLSLFPLEVIGRSRVEYFTLNWLGRYKQMDRYRATWWLLFATYTFPYRQDAALENSRSKEAFCSGIFIIRLISSPPSPPKNSVMFLLVLYLIFPGFHLTLGIENKVIISPGFGEIVSFHFLLFHEHIENMFLIKSQSYISYICMRIWV